MPFGPYPSRVFISQYVYFALSSHTMSAAAITAVLGLEPDEFKVRGNRIAGPTPIPVTHSWKIVCREPGLCVDEQAAHVVERLGPYVEAIAALARQLDAEDNQGPSAVLEVVRQFNDVEGQDRLASAPPDLVDPPDLLGWHLGRDVLGFLHTTGAVLDVDEYDFTPDPTDG